MSAIAAEQDGMTAVTDDVVAGCKSCWRLVTAADNGNRDLAIDDLKFLNNDMEARWGDAWRQRQIDGRPALTINTLPATLALVVNDVRQNRQSIHVHPVGGGADDETAEVIEGLIRHIEYDSNADAAYDTAVSSAAANGFGFFRLIAEYESDASFNQKLCIKRIRNPFTVYFDPLSQEADGSDARFVIISTRIGKAEFKQEYPKANATQDLFEGPCDGEWLTQDEVRIAEFYRVEHDLIALHLLSNGETMWADDKRPLPPGVFKIKTRNSMRRKIMWYKVTAAEKLEEAEIPCKWIPVFPVWGTELDIDGRIHRSGIVRNAKDPSRMYDFFLTTATEEVAMRPRTPYIGAVGQFETAKADWASANQVNYSYLEYDPVTVEGTVVGAPQRQPMADVPAGNLQMCAIARDNIKATTGIYDASLGARGNETSGKGIQARQRQGDIANFHYSDNLSRAIRHLGRCIVSYLPAIYDTPRVLRLLGEDGSATTAEINTVKREQDELGQTIERVLNDLTVGEYDVVISSGPAYSTLRQEAMDSMIAVGQSWPKLWEIAGDKVVKSMDWPGAQEIAERIEKTLPPGLVEREGDESADMVETPRGPIPKEQAGQLIGQMNDALEQLQAELDDKQIVLEKERIAAQSREKVAQINAEARGDAEELKGLVQLILARVPDPAATIQAAETVVEEAPAGPDPMQEYMGQIGQALAALAQSQQQLAQGLTAPREVVRDPQTGRALGMRVAQQPEAAPEGMTDAE
jgi:hypothetical protein